MTGLKLNASLSGHNVIDYISNNKLVNCFNVFVIKFD